MTGTLQALDRGRCRSAFYRWQFLMHSICTLQAKTAFTYLIIAMTKYTHACLVQLCSGNLVAGQSHG